jgi:lysophospholipase L1-like esterase
MGSRASRTLAGTSLGVVAGGVTLVVVEALVASLRRYLPADSAPPVEGVRGDVSRPLLRLTMLGDSTAAGVGANRTEDTVGWLLADGLAEDYQVVLSGVAISGSRSGDLGPQVSRALLLRPDVAVILIGANDAIHGTPPAVAARSVFDAVHRLRSAGVAVVVGTCPDMGARAFAWPLRAFVAWQGRRIARASAIATHQADGSVVSLGELCGPLFHADPATMSSDHFHPSDRGYQVWAEALLPAVRHAASTRQAH